MWMWDLNPGDLGHMISLRTMGPLSPMGQMDPGPRLKMDPNGPWDPGPMSQWALGPRPNNGPKWALGGTQGGPKYHIYKYIYTYIRIYIYTLYLYDHPLGDKEVAGRGWGPQLVD